jgi:hypothetical protein
MSEDRAFLQDKLREALARGDADRAGMLRAAIQSHAREMSTFVDKTMEEAPSERVDLANGQHDQLLIPGGERSAKQAAAAREGLLKAKAPQQDAGGLFAPPEPDQDSLKFAKAPIFYSALERHIDNSTLKAARPDNLRPTAPTPPERLAEIAKRYGEGAVLPAHRARDGRLAIDDQSRHRPSWS